MAGCVLQLCLREQRCLLTGWNIRQCMPQGVPQHDFRLLARGFLLSASCAKLPARIFRREASGVRILVRGLHCKASGALLPARGFRCKVSRERLPAHGFLCRAFRAWLTEHGFRREAALQPDVIDLIRGERILTAAVAHCLKKRKKLAASRLFVTSLHQVEASTSPDCSWPSPALKNSQNFADNRNNSAK